MSAVDGACTVLARTPVALAGATVAAYRALFTTASVAQANDDVRRWVSWWLLAETHPPADGHAMFRVTVRTPTAIAGATASTYYTLVTTGSVPRSFDAGRRWIDWWLMDGDTEVYV